MDFKNSSNNDISELSTEKTSKSSVITLHPCDFDPEEDDNVNSSEDSIDSSELVDDSDDEAQVITEFLILNKKLDKDDENKDEKIGYVVSV